MQLIQINSETFSVNFLQNKLKTKNPSLLNKDGFFIYSLKVMMAKCAVIFSFLQATVFEICGSSRTDINRFCLIFQQVLYHREQFSNRV